MHIRNKISNFEVRTVDSVIYETIKWCVRRWGLNKKRKLDLMYQVIWMDAEVYGEFFYYNNQITVYPLLHKNIGELIDTIIHEYTHHLQSGSKYQELSQKYKYAKHPLEIEANKISSENRLICWREIKHMFN